MRSPAARCDPDAMGAPGSRTGRAFRVLLGQDPQSICHGSAHRPAMEERLGLGGSSAPDALLDPSGCRAGNGSNLAMERLGGSSAPDALLDPSGCRAGNGTNLDVLDFSARCHAGPATGPMLMDWTFRQDAMPGLGGLEAMKSPSPPRPSQASSSPRSEMGILKELVRRCGAVKGSAGVRAEAVKECALERVTAVRGRLDSAGSAATASFMLARNRVKLWWVEKAKARALRTQFRATNKKIFELECLLEKEEYELSLVEYQQWRIERALWKHHDISMRMEKVNMLGPAFRPTPPVRLFPEGTLLLPPKRPLEKSFTNYLKSTEQCVSLFDRVLDIMVVRPVTSVGVASSAVAAVMEAYEELKAPGTFRKHIHRLSNIMMAQGSNGNEEAVDEAKDM